MSISHDSTYPSIGSTRGHSSKSKWVDSKKSSSFAGESEAFIEFGKKKEDDVESIQEGGDLEMKLDIIDESTEGKKDNEVGKSVAMANTSFGVDTSDEGALDEVEKGKDDQNEPQDKDPSMPSSTATTFGGQNSKEAANSKDNSSSAATTLEVQTGKEEVNGKDAGSSTATTLEVQNDKDEVNGKDAGSSTATMLGVQTGKEEVNGKDTGSSTETALGIENGKETANGKDNGSSKD